MSREKTNDEVRKEFMAWVVEGCVDAMRHPSRKEAVLHAVFRVLSTLEGSGDFPYCAVIPQPHPDAADYLRENHEDWYPCPGVEQEAADQALLRGEDHHMFVEMFHQRMDALCRKEGEVQA